MVSTLNMIYKKNVNNINLNLQIYSDKWSLFHRYLINIHVSRKTRIKQ